MITIHVYTYPHGRGIGAKMRIFTLFDLILTSKRTNGRTDAVSRVRVETGTATPEAQFKYSRGDGRAL